MTNRNGMLVDIQLTQATGNAEEEAAEAMLKRQARKRIRPKTLGADKGYDTQDFARMLRKPKVTPHVAQNTEPGGGSATDGRTVRHVGYQISQRIRKRLEEIRGWIKSIGGFRKTSFKGVLRTQLAGRFVGAAYKSFEWRNRRRWRQRYGVKRVRYPLGHEKMPLESASGKKY